MAAVADPYFPPYSEVSSRNSGNKARALGDPFRVPPEFVRAETHDLWEKFRLFRRTPDGWFRCYLCGKRILGNSDWHLDHVFPLALGGTHVIDNLDAAHGGCNSSKGATRLEELLTSEELAEVKANGWPPAFERLSTKPVDELWVASKAAARRFARTPRHIPVKATAKWATPRGGDVDVARVLAEQPDPWEAMLVSELSRVLGHASATSLKQQWLIAMGLGGYDSRGQDVERRNPDSPFIVPTRKPTDSTPLGEPAFRLRFEGDPTSLLDQGGSELRQFRGDHRR